MNLNTKQKWGVAIGLALAGISPFLMFWFTSKISKPPSIPKYYFATGMDTMIDEKGNKKLDSTYQIVSDFSFTNQLGETYKYYKNSKGKIVVAYLFFTNCKTICPKLSTNAGLIQKAFAKRDTTVNIIGLSVDPQNDTVPALRQYAQKLGANHEVWFLLTGDKKSIYNLARSQLHLDNSTTSTNEIDFVHSEKMVLLDRNHHIRGYYNGLDTLDIQRLCDDIILLDLEKNIKK